MQYICIFFKKFGFGLTPPPQPKLNDNTSKPDRFDHGFFSTWKYALHHKGSSLRKTNKTTIAYLPHEQEAVMITSLHSQSISGGIPTRDKSDDELWNRTSMASWLGEQA